MDTNDSSCACKRTILSQPSSLPNAKKQKIVDTVESNSKTPWGKLVSRCSQVLRCFNDTFSSSSSSKDYQELVDEKKVVTKSPWGKLISLCSKTSHILMYEPTFTVGQGNKYDLSVNIVGGGDLCVLKPTQTEGGEWVTYLEIHSQTGYVKINGMYYYGKNHNVVRLNGGDELIFATYGLNGYIFQRLSNSSAPETGVTTSSAIREGLHVEPQSEIKSELPIPVASRCQDFKDGLQKGLLDSEMIDVSF